MPRRHQDGHGHGHSHGPSQRQLRMGEVVRHVLAEVFLRRDLQDPDLQGANLIISEVRVTADMRNAIVFVACLGGGEMTPILAALKRAKGYLRSRVGAAITTKFTPDLVFEEDRSYDEAQRITQLLRSKEIAADLQPKEEEDGETS